jgi:phosphatidylglycerophosphatase A
MPPSDPPSPEAARPGTPPPAPRLVTVLATGFGAGYAPVAPGTFGTLVGIPFAVALARVPGAFVLPVLVVSVGLACWVAGQAERVFAQKDPGRIVIDEVVGYLVSLAFLPVTPWTLVGAFLLFRVFDVLKPWPARQLERRLPGGYGVVLDDVAAGIWANAALRVAAAILGAPLAPG